MLVIEEGAAGEPRPFLVSDPPSRTNPEKVAYRGVFFQMRRRAVAVRRGSLGRGGARWDEERTIKMRRRSLV